MKQEFSEPNNKKGFTLAETLITLTILGIVAAITIPALINRQQEAANRTKVKKAMTMYEKALNQMIIENDLKTNNAIIAFGAEGGACANTTEYFKKVEGNGCRFKTADRIWWDISDIENPLIILNDKKKDETVANLQALAKDTNDITTYAMIGRLDETTNAGIVRINDNAFEQANGTADQKAYMTKLYGFLNGNNAPNNNNIANIPLNTELNDAMKNLCTTDPPSNCYTTDGKAYNSKGELIIEGSCHFEDPSYKYCDNGTTVTVHLDGKTYTYEVEDFPTTCFGIDENGNISFYGKLYDENNEMIADCTDSSCMSKNENTSRFWGKLYSDNTFTDLIADCGNSTCFKNFNSLNYLNGVPGMERGSKVYNDDFSEVLFECNSYQCVNQADPYVWNGTALYNDDWTEVVATCDGTQCYKKSYNTTGLSNGSKIYSDDWSEVIFECNNPRKCTNTSWKYDLLSGDTLYNDDWTEVLCTCQGTCRKQADGSWSNCR